MVLYVIAFDGMHRSGKGEQTFLLRLAFKRRGLPSVILRGDGSRPGTGTDEGDPPDRWWMDFRNELARLRNPAEQFDLWFQAACRLATEFLTWKYQIMPGRLAAAGSADGVIILDRSLVSRMNLAIKAGHATDLDGLYHQAGVWKELLPDILFYLAAPQTVLLERLKPNDPKFEFRRELLIQGFGTFERAASNLPGEVSERLVRLDAARSLGEVHDAVLSALAVRLPNLVEG